MPIRKDDPNTRFLAYSMGLGKAAKLGEKKVPATLGETIFFVLILGTTLYFLAIGH